jgi:regulatory protein
VQEESSNSLNDKLADLDNETLETVITVRSLENMKGAKREEVKVHLSDGSFFYLQKDILFQAGLFAGAELSYREALRLIVQSERLALKHKALELLATVHHSRTGLRLKLLKKGYSSPSLDAVLDELTELGYLNDEAFAKEWLQFRIKKHPEGKQALLAGLQEKGIDRSLAERCIRELLKPEDELENVDRLIAKLTRFREVEDEQLIARLRTKGFSYDLIKKALKQRAHPDAEEES